MKEGLEIAKTIGKFIFKFCIIGLAGATVFTELNDIDRFIRGEDDELTMP